MRSKAVWYLALVSLLMIGCSSDDGPKTDASPSQLDGGVADAAGTADASALQTDGTDLMPGCSPECADDQVCLNRTCTTVGPTRECGSGEYAADLPANEGTFYVNGAYTGGDSDGTRDKPYQTIKAALEAIPAGKKVTVAVAAGEYDEELTIGVRGSGNAEEEFGADLYCRCTEQVRITRPLTIKHGVQPLEVTIDGCTIAPAGFDAESASDWPTCKPATHGVEALGGYVDFHLLIKDSVIGGWCTGIYYSAEPSPVLNSSLCVAHCRLSANVRGLEVKNAPATQVQSPFAQCNGGTENLALTLSRIDHNRDYGVYTYDKARGIALSANVIDSTGEVGGNQTGEGYGVYLGDTDSATLSDNVIRDNHNRGVGMRNDKATVPFGITINGNVVSNNRGAGIALQRMQAVKAITITNNSVLGTRTLQGEPGGDGIQVSSDGAASYNVDISDNIVDGSERNGIFYDGLGGTVSNNTISNNAGHGCLLQQSTTDVGENTFADNASGNVESVSDPSELYGALPVPLP
jgi:hypothetical protein